MADRCRLASSVIDRAAHPAGCKPAANQVIRPPERTVMRNIVTQTDGTLSRSARRAYAGWRASPAELPSGVDPRVLIEVLSTAERDVLALLAQGHAPKQAAYERGTAIATVRSQIAAAKRKTGARTLGQLVALFTEATVAR
jgi:DNA-binding CsgD family transcriptional regulator